MPRRGPPSRALTIFLLKETPDSGVAALKDTVAFREHAVDLSTGDRGTLFVGPQHRNRPKWAGLFDACISPPIGDLYNASTQAVLVVRAHGRSWAITFGHGRHLLVPGAWEENFGLRVTLNSIPPDKIRSIDRQSFDALARHTRTQVSREATVADFGVDVEQDLIRAVTGTPRDRCLGSRLTGMDALTTSVPIELAGLAPLLGVCLAQFQNDSYKRDFPWIDQMTEQRDPVVVAQLNATLLQKINSGDFERLWMAPPEVVDWQEIAGFKYRDARKHAVQPDLHLVEFLATVADATAVTFDDIKKRRRVYLIGASSDQVLKSWSVFDCVYCEIDSGADTYLLSSGRWYRIASDFVSQVNDAVKALVRDKRFEPYDHASEGEYNRDVAVSAGFGLVDRKLIMHGGGHSKVELCDLVTASRELIHVKRYSGSSGLSHLFAQAEVSGNLLAFDDGFRAKAHDVLPASHKNLFAPTGLNPGDFEIVMAIVSRSGRPINESLPFFSRVNLRRCAQRLRGYGYRVSLCKIAAGPRTEKKLAA